ncbi:hypothetical protein [Streptomyces daqingensis]|nr:hypothetical protein [Streptomyces daqingensis]
MFVDELPADDLPAVSGMAGFGGRRGEVEFRAQLVQRSPGGGSAGSSRVH